MYVVDLRFIVSSSCTLDTWCGGGREWGQNSSVLFLALSLTFEQLFCLSDLLLFSLNVAICLFGLQKKGDQGQREPGMGNMNTTDSFLMNNSRLVDIEGAG